MKDNFTSLHAAVASACGENVTIAGKRPVSGGDINEAYCLLLSNGGKLFLKTNRAENADFFRAEAEGLFALQKTGTVRTPEVLARGVDSDLSFLLLSHIESGRKTGAFFTDLGRQLAALHRAPTKGFVPGGRYGFLSDNYIGAGKQKNTPAESWVTFFAECRLRPQFERASSYFTTGERRAIDALLARLDRYLVEPEFPSLLHGDLWGGNTLAGEDGRAWLIDPAAYVGHAEADLAMTELFGGFAPDFYDAYREICPIDPTYRDRRKLYNLYHLLNHLNLFGGGYLSAVREVLRRYRHLQN